LLSGAACGYGLSLLAGPRRLMALMQCCLVSWVLFALYRSRPMPTVPARGRRAARVRRKRERDGGAMEQACGSGRQAQRRGWGGLHARASRALLLIPSNRIFLGCKRC